MQRFKQIFFLLLSICISTQLSATHIVGGDVSYQCEGYNSDSTAVVLLFEFTIYRDLFSGGANFDDDARFGIWRGSGTNWTHFETINDLDFTDRDEIEVVDDPCVDVPSMVGVEKAVYRFNYSLPLDGQDYILAYQRCCRNPTIANLFNPGDTGAAFQIEIKAESLELCNDSPKFDRFPPIFICANFDVNFNHSASDAQGDQLVYEFCAPLQAGGTDGSNGFGDPNSCTGVRPDPENCGPVFDPVDFRPPFEESNPMGGDPVVTINPVTGLISGVPNIQGQYVVGVCAKEYRNGILLSEIRRDFQFNVVMCTPLVVAELDAGLEIDGLEYAVVSCGESVVTIRNTSYQESSILSYDWVFDLGGGDTLKADTRDLTLTLPGVGTYTGTMILNEGTGCADTANVVIDYFPSMEADFEIDYDTCIAGPVAFIDKSTTEADDIVGWEWFFEDGETSNDSDPSYIFSEPGIQTVTLISEDNNECKDTLRKDIPWYPVPPLVVVQPNKFLACAPGEISFNNLSDPINEEYIINWNFGDGTSTTGLSPTHTYEDSGIYSVDVEIISPIGCVTEKSYPNWITVEDKPEAIFTYTPENPNVFNKEIDFTDMSIDSETQQWNFNNEYVTLEQNPTYTFQDTGLYEIRLIAFHETGCPDTTIQFIDIEPLVDYYVPNAFTPNGDGDNDTFIGKGFLQGLKDFQMNIYNRWGEQIYVTEDPFNGWNGRKENSGQQAPQGVYVWEVKYIGARGDVENQRGHVTLLR